MSVLLSKTKLVLSKYHRYISLLNNEKKTVISSVFANFHDYTVLSKSSFLYATTSNNHIRSWII